MHRRTATILAFVLIILCLTALALQNPQSTPQVPPAKPAEPAASAQPAGSAQPASPATPDASSNLVVARVSGEPITEKQVVAAIEVLAKQTVIKPEQKNQRNTILFKGALDNLITLTILKAEAKRLMVTVDKAKVDQQMQVFASRFPSKEEFEKAMAGQGVNEAEVRKSVEETWSVQEVLNLATKNVPEPSDAEIQKAYDSNPFAVPERAHVAQLFLKMEPNSTPEQKAEIKKKLEGIRADIESKKVTFIDAVSKYSQDPNGPKNGDVGFVAREQISIKSMQEAIFAAAPGSMTPVIEGPQGFHLVNVIEIAPAGKMPLEEAKPQIKQQLDQVAKQKAIQKYVEDLKSKATIEPFMTAEEFDKRHPF